MTQVGATNSFWPKNYVVIFMQRTIRPLDPDGSLYNSPTAHVCTTRVLLSTEVTFVLRNGVHEGSRRGDGATAAARDGTAPPLSDVTFPLGGRC